MADIKWIKIATNVFDDQKIRMIETMPEGDSIIVIWFKLLTLAGKINDGGFVYFMRDIPYTDQMLSTYLNRPLPTVQLALSTFIKFGMIEIVDDIIFLSNWEKHQNTDKLDKIRDDTRKRVAKHREKKRLEIESANCNVTETLQVTQCNATEEERREKKEEQDIRKKSIYNAHFEEFWQAYAKKRDKKRAYDNYLARLKDGFSEEELLTACKNYMAECKKQNREEKYIKDAKTFLSVNLSFEEYIPKGRTKGLREIKLAKQTEEEKRQFPYYGLPKEFFKGDMITSDLVYPVKDIDTGEEYTVDFIIDEYSIRRVRATENDENLELRCGT